MRSLKLVCGAEVAVEPLKLDDERTDILLEGLRKIQEDKDPSDDDPSLPPSLKRLRKMLALLLSIYAPELLEKSVPADISNMGTHLPLLMLRALGDPLADGKEVSPSSPTPATGETGRGQG